MLNLPPSSPDRGKGSLRESAAKGALLVVVLKATGVAAGRAAQLVLPFFLLPEDFGIFALASFFFGLLNLAADLGMSTDLVRRRESFEAAADTAFVLRLLLGISCFAMSGLVAWFAAIAFGEPRLVLPLVVLSLGLMLQALSMVPRVIAMRNLDFRRAAIPDHAGKFAGTFTTIGLAVVGLAYWAPVYGTVVGIALGTALQLAVSRWRPRFRFHRDLAGNIVRFGQFVTFTSFANFIAHSIDAALVGLILGVAALGFYAFAYSWGVYFVSNLASVFASVGYPVLSHVSDSPARMKRVFLENLRYYGYIAVALSAGTAVLAPLFIESLYGSTWTPAVLPMQVLATVGFLLGIAAITGDALYALGRSKTVFLVSFLEALVVVGVVPPATVVGGLLGTSLAAVAGATLLCIGLTGSIRRSLDIRSKEWIGAVAHSSAAGLLAAIPAQVLVAFVSPTIQGLLVALVAYLGAYVLLLQSLTHGRFFGDLKGALALALR